MKKIVIALLLVLFSFICCTAAIANEIDDQNVAELFAAAQKVRPYGDDCWEVKFHAEWKLPEWNPLGDNATFRFYALEPDALKRPLVGNYSYPDHIKKFIPITKRTFAPGENALIICLPQNMKFADYREHVFKPWVEQDNKGRSDEWTFIKVGSKWLAKNNWHINHTWYDGVRSIQDFACYGSKDKNLIKIEGNSITFIPRTEICFNAKHYGSNIYLYQWKDAEGETLASTGRALEPGKQVTITFEARAPRPKGWD